MFTFIRKFDIDEMSVFAVILLNLTILVGIIGVVFLTAMVSGWFVLFVPVAMAPWIIDAYNKGA
jgi:hypothetical protein